MAVKEFTPILFGEESMTPKKWKAENKIAPTGKGRGARKKL
jgi:hypothetical protein